MTQNRFPLLPLILDDVPVGLRRALAQEGIPVRNRRPGPPEGRFLLFDSRRTTRPAPAAGQIAVDIDPLREVCDADPFEALLDQRAARCQWQIGGLTVGEEVARVDKRTLRRQIIEPLRQRIEEAGGIWLRVAAFPFPYRSALNFRIDYDQYEPPDFDAVLQTIAGNEQATSHFVSGSAYEGAGEALARLRGLDVGSHGYWHHVYRTREENLRNVGRGIEVLRSGGIEPSGFAGPHGRFNRKLLSALKALGVSHSSEFGLAYDELPFFPAGADVLQIPIHPVSLGIFLEAATPDGEAVAADRAAEYFEELAQARYRAGEPVFFYGHPTGRLGRYPQVLSRVFQTASVFGAIWRTTLSGFADWWRARAGVKLTVTRRDDEFVVTTDGKLPAYRLGVEYWRGRHVALMPMDGHVVRFSPQALAYESRGGRPAVRPVRIDRPEGLRGRVRRWIDWERVTPVDQIGSGNWRNWTKRTLRRWWHK